MPYDYQSSLPAYQENKTGKDYCRSQVFIAIRKLGICTDKQISAYLKWAINSVTPRRLELVENGLVVLAMKAPDPDSHRTVSWWKIKEVNHQPVLF